MVARLAQLNREREDLERRLTSAIGALGLPLVGSLVPGRRGKRADESLRYHATAPAPRGARKRRGMSAAQRKAVGERMRKYWAERRKQSAKK